MENKQYKKCQSCGMPLKKDTDRVVDQKDINTTKYCSHCYKDGKFTQDFTQEQMEEHVFNYMRNDMKLPKFICNMGKKQVCKLERWQK